jgi:hypothetical protein
MYESKTAPNTKHLFEMGFSFELKCISGRFAFCQVFKSKTKLSSLTFIHSFNVGAKKKKAG